MNHSLDRAGHCMAKDQYISQLRETFATSVPSRIAAFFGEPIQVSRTKTTIFPGCCVWCELHICAMMSCMCAGSGRSCPVPSELSQGGLRTREGKRRPLHCRWGFFLILTQSLLIFLLFVKQNTSVTVIVVIVVGVVWFQSHSSSNLKLHKLNQERMCVWKFCKWIPSTN